MVMDEVSLRRVKELPPTVAREVRPRTPNRRLCRALYGRSSWIDLHGFGVW